MNVDRQSTVRSAVPVVLTGVVVALIWGDRLLFHTAPVGAAAYHQAVAETTQTVPTFVGSWLGADIALPQAAIRLLHPNAHVSRRYRNVTTGRTITFLVIQCSDARDLIGHYPPICYVNQGWTMDWAKPASWSVDDLDVKATQYGFTSSRIGQAASLHIDNFMVLPTGATCPDMNGIYASAKDPHKKFFGAAQVQFVCDADLPAAERDEFERNLLRASRPLFDSIRAGVRQ